MKRQNTITIVSGLPRSGTSMLMQVLEAGGMEILTDKIRTPDEDNPKGYYELESIKKLEKCPQVILSAKGKVVKIISFLLKFIPQNEQYSIIFMRRGMNEILRSQKKMLIRRGTADGAECDDTIAKILKKDLRKTEEWLAARPSIKVLYVDFHEMVSNPKKMVKTINQYLGGDLDEAAMAMTVDPGLYRQKIELVSNPGS